MGVVNLLGLQENRNWETQRVDELLEGHLDLIALAFRLQVIVQGRALNDGPVAVVGHYDHVIADVVKGQEILGNLKVAVFGFVLLHRIQFLDHQEKASSDGSDDHQHDQNDQYRHRYFLPPRLENVLALLGLLLPLIVAGSVHTVGQGVDQVLALLLELEPPDQILDQGKPALVVKGKGQTNCSCRDKPNHESQDRRHDFSHADKYTCSYDKAGGDPTSLTKSQKASYRLFFFGHVVGDTIYSRHV